MLIKITNFLLDLIFPPLCIACRKHLETKQEKATLLCAECFSSIIIYNQIFYSENFPFLAVSRYNSPTVRKIIHVLKYQKMTGAITPIKHLIKSYFENPYFKTIFKESEWTIVPIPLHKKKKRKRGFNQAFLIAEVLQKNLQISYPNKKFKIEMILQKNEVTKTQAELNLKERRSNIVGTFKIKEKAEGNFIIADDVFTSGATLNEAAKTLKKAGADKIAGFVVAKT